MYTYTVLLYFRKPENKFKMWMKLFLPFFYLSSHPSDPLKSGISSFLAKKSPFSWIIDPSIGIFWLLCKTNHSNRALSTFLYSQPRDFLVLRALSSSAWKTFSLFLLQVEMVFLGTPNISGCLFICHVFLYVWQNVTLFLQSFCIKLTFDRHFCFGDTENKKQIFFHSWSKFLFWCKFEFIREFEN